MPVVVNCPCGKQLRVRDELAGKHIRCPACAGVVAVPAPAAELLTVEPVEDEAPESLPEVQPVHRPPVLAVAEPPKSDMDDSGSSPPPGAFRVWRHYTFSSFLPLAVLVALLSPVPLLIMLSVRAENQAFAREGVLTEGIVTDKSRFRSKGGWTNTVHYRYTVGGQTFEDSGTVSDGKWALLNAGDRVPVRYLASDPAQSKPQYTSDEERALVDQIGIGIGVAVLVFAPLFLLLSYRGVARRVRLLRRGTCAVARITAINPQYGALQYRYTDSAGKDHDGRTAKPDPKKMYRRGDGLAVVYDPKKPGRHEIDVLGVRSGG